MLYNHLKTVVFRLMKEKSDTHNKGAIKGIKSPVKCAPVKYASPR